ncbi:uncharacterized protein Ecym_6109 [Eremothecium cymbalariae DBVPG|uniref:Uncharacterized protein n=1 Tax=Eremothecium cymbalariae (strain CBS 270.75 / DBVPG 7215 / KCTC 17166 / NRRL Y-17582) TaxID=931890 RepID=G8JV24_ERECY|nr:hypothetical protein Ecym_6109 [Eremothecium cymbalariae DBVPG\
MPSSEGWLLGCGWRLLLLLRRPWTAAGLGGRLPPTPPNSADQRDTMDAKSISKIDSVVRGPLSKCGSQAVKLALAQGGQVHHVGVVGGFAQAALAGAGLEGAALGQRHGGGRWAVGKRHWGARARARGRGRGHLLLFSVLIGKEKRCLPGADVRMVTAHHAGARVFVSVVGCELVQNTHHCCVGSSFGALCVCWRPSFCISLGFL